MVAILDAVTDQTIRHFPEADLVEAVVFVLFECEPDAVVFHGEDMARTQGIPAAAWVQAVDLPYAPAANLVEGIAGDTSLPSSPIS
jgi:hypothetical protein